MRAELDSLESRIGYRFADKEILRRALTHSSHVYDRYLAGETGGTRDNEQLEFLGDSILGFLVSEALVARFPAYSEGALSRIKAHFVGAVHLCAVAQRLELGEYLQLGRGEERSGGREKKALLENALEAVIAAIYLDGGMEAARRFVSAAIIGAGDWAAAADQASRTVDFRASLLDLSRERNLPAPRYALVQEQGPVHSRIFTIEVRIGKERTAQAEAPSKKAAAQLAARELYERISDEPPNVP